MKEFYNKLNPKTKIWVIRAGVLLALIIIGYPLYKHTSTKKRETKAKSEYKVLHEDASTFEKALYTETKAEIEELKKTIKELNEKIGNMQETNEAQPQTPEKDIFDFKAPKNSEPFNKREMPASNDLEKPKRQSEGKPLKASQLDMDKLKREVEREVLARTPPPAGSDAVRQELFKAPARTGREETGQEKAAKPGIKTISGMSEKQKDKNTIMLPPSFMDASLLTGVLAPTTQASSQGQTSKTHTVPMLIRIKDLAVLPNEVKEDLKGCFVIAEGSGDLAKERVDTRLLNLSCITNSGDAIIDQKVKGWVVDADGRAGLSGVVVAKYGSHIARVAVAGFMEGFGEAFSASVEDTNVNIVGGTTTTLKDNETETILKAGTGNAVVKASQDLEDFYLQLARQTMPVIEVGPTKNITVIISDGEELVIKERKKRG